MKRLEFRAASVKLLLQFGNPVKAGFLAGFVYFLLASLHGKPWDVSVVPYFNYLADAFLHGQLNLRLLPQTTHDLVFYSSNYYLYWPPFPAVVLMPFIAIFGVNFSDVLFTVILGGVDIYLVGVLLTQANKKNIISLTDFQRSLLTFFFAFGTVILTLAPLGRVWFTAQLIGLFFVLLSYISTLSFTGIKAFFYTGLALGAALATRNNLVFAGIWPALYLVATNWGQPRGKLVRQVITGAVPVILSVAILAIYNWSRFGNPLDVGLTYHQMASVFEADFQKYGPFNFYYALTNLYYQYIYYPFPIRSDFFMGGSLFLLSPLFFASFWALVSEYPLWSRLGLVISILLINVPILLLMGTGWVQFGPRYSLDFSIPLLLLTAMGMTMWRNSISSLAVAVSTIQYFAGAVLLIKSI